MDSREAMMEDTATPTVLPQEQGASILEDPSQMAVLEALDPTGYIPLPPILFDDNHAGMDSWPAGEIRSPSIPGLGETHVSIQNIYELVGDENTWLAGLYSTPHLPSRCSRLSTQELFDRGFSAMQQCFNGSLTDSIEDVFSLVHVACALAYWLHKDEDLYDWGGLFLHIHQWQYLLSDHDDVQCFLMVMDQLTCGHNYHLTNPLNGGGIYDQQTYETTFDMLRNGPVMSDCSTFLDGLEFQRLFEPDMVLLPHPLQWNAQYFDNPIQYMVASITAPLRDDPNTDGFHDIIYDAESRLHAGLLRNPREVEVLLLVNGKSYARSSGAFENYKLAVIGSCDRALGQPDSSWRNQYYATAIDGVRAESVTHGNHQQPEARFAEQDTSVPAVVRPYQSDVASPQSVTSAESESMDDIFPSSPTIMDLSTSMSSLGTDTSTSYSNSPTTMDLSTSVSSLGTDTSNSYSNSPMTAAASSPSPPAPQNPAAARTFHCDPCNKTFNDRANFRRHQRTSNAHGDGSMYPCLVPGCTRSYNRADNLGGHVKKAHPDSKQVPL